MKKYLKLVCLFVCLFSLLNLSEAASRVSQFTRDKLANELPILGMNVGNEVLIRTFKKESRLELWVRPTGKQHYTLFRTYPICYYSGSLGPKRRTGDKMTPEGFYAVTQRRLNPNSRFHLSMDIGYPNAFDRHWGRSGSLLMIHGACDAIGCFAMSNSQIEEIYYLVEQALANGQNKVAVHAFPFHLTDKQLKEYKKSPWFDFWQQLQAGYNAFNKTRQPPVIKVINGRYVVEKIDN